MADDKPPEGLTEVFNSEKDACSKNNDVKVSGKNGTVVIKTGETKQVELPAITVTFDWECDNTTETFKYPSCPPFNWLRVQRSSDTARIKWTCYKKQGHLANRISLAELIAQQNTTTEAICSVFSEELPWKN